jgi:hypothetical protein
MYFWWVLENAFRFWWVRCTFGGFDVLLVGPLCALIYPSPNRRNAELEHLNNLVFAVLILSCSAMLVFSPDAMRRTRSARHLLPPAATAAAHLASAGTRRKTPATVLGDKEQQKVGVVVLATRKSLKSATKIAAAPQDNDGNDNVGDGHDGKK